MITNDRKIYIIGDIDHEMYSKFTRKLSRLEEESDEPIHIVLCSDGGDGQVSLAFFDRIRMSPCIICVCGVGLVASAAALILIAPPDVRNRSMTRNAWLMIHDDSVGSTLEDHRVVHAERKIRQYRRYEDQWNKLFAESTGRDVELWDKLHRKETHLTPEDALLFGIIGEIK